MTGPGSCGVLCGCSVLQYETESLRRQFWPGWTGEYLSSMLHMRPAHLGETLQHRIRDLDQGSRIVLVYGDCCPAMHACEQYPHVARTQGMNCCELILGHEIYKKLIRSGVFFLLPEWTSRWEEVFSRELGFNQKNASDFMGEMHSRIVYLDTGVIPVPSEEIEACARYCSLPWEILPVSSDHLRMQIQHAMDRLDAGTGLS